MRSLLFYLLLLPTVLIGQENNDSQSDFASRIGELNERHKTILNNVDQIQELIKKVRVYADAVQHNADAVFKDELVEDKQRELERMHLSPVQIRKKFVEKARGDVDKMLANLLLLSSEMEAEIVDAIRHSNRLRTKLSTDRPESRDEILKALEMETKNQENLKRQRKQLEFLIEEIRTETYVLFDYTYIDLIFYLYQVEKDVMKKMRENLEETMGKIDKLVERSGLIPNNQSLPKQE